MTIGTAQLDSLFNRINGLRVGVLGDFCLDVYWRADMRKSELSRETPHFPLPVVDERMQPGGAGNVACNLAALQPGTVIALTVLGRDWRGGELLSQLRAHQIDTLNIVQSAGRVTNAYIKPMRKGISDTEYEDPRLDFENHQPLHEDDERQLAEMLRNAANSLDVLCVCDQMRLGNITPKIREIVCGLGADGLPVFVDSRDRIMEYQNVMVKPNEIELCRAMGQPLTTDMDRLSELAMELAAHTGRPLIVTLGERGALALENGRQTLVAAYPARPPLDICGAGDTYMATAALLHAAGASFIDAAVYAACSASLTVQKLHMTGVTTREELAARAAEYCGHHNTAR